MNEKFLNEIEVIKNLKWLIRLRDVKLQEKEIIKNKPKQELFEQKIIINKEIKIIEKDINKLCKYLTYSQYVLSIRGISKLSAAIFLTEINDPMRFPDYKHLLSYLGFFIYQRKCTRLCPGQRIVKKQLFLMSEQVVRRNEYFKNYYKNKLNVIDNLGRKTNKTEAMFLVSLKLVRVMFALMREKKMFVDYDINVNREAKSEMIFV